MPRSRRIVLPNLWQIPGLLIAALRRRWETFCIRRQYAIAALGKPSGIQRAFSPGGLAYVERDVCEMLERETE